jgi:hypothetical protein
VELLPVLVASLLSACDPSRPHADLSGMFEEGDIAGQVGVCLSAFTQQVRVDVDESGTRAGGGRHCGQTDHHRGPLGAAAADPGDRRSAVSVADLRFLERRGRSCWAGGHSIAE